MLPRPCARSALLLLLAGALAAAPAAAQDVRREEPPPPAAPPKLTRPPELLEAAEPTYPPAAASAGLEADVLVRISVDATGAVTDAQVVEPVGRGFDEAAVEAARRYRFRPAEWDGQPGPIVVETTIHFRIELEPEPEPGPGPAATPGGAGGAQPPGPTGEIRGVVKERGTRRKLAGAAVGIEGAAADAVSGADGSFSITAPVGRRRLIVALSGYDRFERQVDVTAGRTEVEIYLRPKGASPYETYVEGERDTYVVTKHEVPRRVMMSVPGTYGDPVRVVQNLPGVARMPYGLGLLIVRGTRPQDSGTYLDGHKIPLLFHFLGGPSILNPEFLENIDLFPGGYPVRFGRALGGIVSVTTRPSVSDGVHGAAEVDLIDSGAYLRAPLGKDVSVAVAGRRSYVDNLLPYFLPEGEEGQTTVVVPVYWDYQARVDARLPHGARLSVLGFGSDDRLRALSSNEKTGEEYDIGMHIGFHHLVATYVRPLGQLQLSLSPALGRDVGEMAAGDRSGLSGVETVYAMRERVTGLLAPGVRLDAGIDEEYRISSYTARLPIDIDVISSGHPPETETRELKRSIDYLGIALHAEVGWDVGGGVRLVPGLRLDTYVLAGATRAAFDPRLVVRWQATRPTAFKAYAGLFHQPPTAEAFDREYGNRDLGLERAVQVGAGVERQLTRSLRAEAEVYYGSRDNLTVNAHGYTTNPDGTVRPYYWSNEGVGRSYGLEVLVKHEITRHFFGWLSYTLSRSELRRHPDDEIHPSAFDQTHNFILVASYRTDGGWELGVRFRATSGMPETPFVSSSFDADGGWYVPVSGGINSARAPFFHQLDLRAEKTWLFKTWSIAGFVDVQNVYNAENPEGTLWDYRYRERAPIRGLPIVPTLGVKGQW